LAALLRCSFPLAATRRRGLLPPRLEVDADHQGAKNTYDPEAPHGPERLSLAELARRYLRTHQDPRQLSQTLTPATSAQKSTINPSRLATTRASARSASRIGSDIPHPAIEGIEMPKSLCLAVAVLFGVALGANGVFMLVSPESWYFVVPGVTSTGPFNQHFLRDIGLIFLFLGGAFLVGTARPQFRILLWAAPTIWLCGHALFHFWEVAVGICSPSVIPRDFPAVTLPAIIGVALTIWAIRNVHSAKAASA
jgi:hypothetical protein